MTGRTDDGYVPPLALELAARVRTALLSAGVTQAMLARRLNVSEKHVSRVLNGRDDGSIPFWDAMLREAARPREHGEKGNRPADLDWTSPVVEPEPKVAGGLVQPWNEPPRQSAEAPAGTS